MVRIRPTKTKTSFASVHSALREGSQRSVRWMQYRDGSASSDEDHVGGETRSPKTSGAVCLGKKRKWRCAARRNRRASCLSHRWVGDQNRPASLTARRALECRVQLGRRRTSRCERVAASSLDRPLARTGFLQHLAHCIQIIGCRDDGKEQKQQTGKRKDRLWRPGTRLP